MSSKGDEFDVAMSAFRGSLEGLYTAYRRTGELEIAKMLREDVETAIKRAHLKAISKHSLDYASKIYQNNCALRKKAKREQIEGILIKYFDIDPELFYAHSSTMTIDSILAKTGLEMTKYTATRTLIDLREGEAPRGHIGIANRKALDDAVMEHYGINIEKVITLLNLTRKKLNSYTEEMYGFTIHERDWTHLCRGEFE